MMTENERHTQFDRAITRLAEELGDEWSVSISDRSTHFSQWWGATLSGPGQAAVRVRRLDCERWRMSAEYPPKTGPYGVPSITQTMTRPAVKLAGDLRRRLIDIYLPDLAQALEAAAIADARDDVARGVVDDMEALLPGTYVSDRNAGSHRLRPDLHARWTRQGDVPLSVALHSRANYGAVLTVDGLDPAQARAALEFVARLVQSPPTASDVPPAAPVVEVVKATDDGGWAHLNVFVDGTEVPFTEHSVDAGAGWTWTDWAEYRDATLAAATPAARAVLVEAFADPGGGEYVTGRRGADWLDPVEPGQEPGAA